MCSRGATGVVVIVLACFSLTGVKARAMTVGRFGLDAPAATVRLYGGVQFTI